MKIIIPFFIAILFFFGSASAQDLVLPLWPDNEISNFIDTGEADVFDTSDIVRIRHVQKPDISIYLLSGRNATGNNIVGHKSPLMDAKRAMRLVRHHAGQWDIDPRQVGVIGFSAGGHLASTLSTLFDYGDEDHPDPVERHSSRPDFSALVYPVIASDTSIWHRGSFRALLGDAPPGGAAAEIFHRKTDKSGYSANHPDPFG